MKEKMSMSEAGKLGALASKIVQQKQKADRIEQYNKNPNFCSCCEKPLSYQARKNKFCSSSCSAKCNNVLRANKNYSTKDVKRINARIKSNCKSCGKETERHAKKYCSLKCMQNFAWNNKKNMIEQTGKVNGIKQARRYLLEKYGHKCAVPNCGISEWLGKPVLLICDHINGNSNDWNLTNLRMICSNCDAQTPFYKGKNKGNGRHFRRERYKEGKSF